MELFALILGISLLVFFIVAVILLEINYWNAVTKSPQEAEADRLENELGALLEAKRTAKRVVFLKRELRSLKANKGE